MTRFMFSLLITLMTLTAYSQKDVTKFLGIPVDGTKTQMIQKLKAKGFVCKSWKEGTLAGKFNGQDVNLHIVTNDNKVWRIVVEEKTPWNETDIKIRYNKLCQQFENNSKYIPYSYNQYIPDGEYLYLNLLTNRKRYQATFFQKSSLSNEELFKTNPTMTSAQIAELAHKISKNKLVWFTISELAGDFYIFIYYDNTYNQANGEDL